jgi:hypothetical protein
MRIAAWDKLALKSSARFRARAKGLKKFHGLASCSSIFNSQVIEFAQLWENGKVCVSAFDPKRVGGEYAITGLGWALVT